MKRVLAGLAGAIVMSMSSMGIAQAPEKTERPAAKREAQQPKATAAQRATRQADRPPVKRPAAAQRSRPQPPADPAAYEIAMVIS